MRSNARFALLLASAATVAAATPAPARADDRADRRSPVVRAVEKARPGVVSIRTNEIVRVARYYNWFDYETVPQEREGSLGTGVIFHPQGYVITNAHVISRASKIFVQVTDPKTGEYEREAKTVSVDLDNDLAILRMIGPAAGGEENGAYPWIPLGRSDDLMIGEGVIAIGNPFRLGITVTTGVVSALRRSIRPQGEKAHEFKDFVQIDAAVNPGNSGGPILDVTGRWIGVTTAILNRATGAEGIGFAIPADRVRQTVGRTFQRQIARGEWLGFDLEAGPDGAPLVREVAPGGPAAGTALAKGDRILTLDGMPVPSLFDYRWEEASLPEGASVRLGLVRDGKPAGEVTLRFVPLAASVIATQRLGFAAREAGPDDLKTLGVEAGGGVVVTTVAEGGPSARLGLKAGDVVLSLGEFRVRTLDDLGRFAALAQPGDAVDVVVQRVERTAAGRTELRPQRGTLVAR